MEILPKVYKLFGELMSDREEMNRDTTKVYCFSGRIDYICISNRCWM